MGVVRVDRGPWSTWRTGSWKAAPDDLNLDRRRLYRVRLGPYQSLEDANRIKAALSQNGVGATIIRLDEAKNR